MDQLREMRTFLGVTETRNFSVAARRLGVSRSTVTKVISGLEHRIGAILVTRSTHHVTITPAGEVFACEAREILARVDDLHQRIEDAQFELKGEIHIGAPAAFATMHLVRAIIDFRALNPQVEFRIVADDGTLNVIKEALDFSVRIAPTLPDMALISQLLVRVPQVLVASPGYLDMAGTPQVPEDLSGHQCLIHTIKSPNRHWTFDGDRTVAVRGAVSSNLGDTLRQAALIDAGISLHPAYMVHDDLEAGRLRQVLAAHRPEEMAVHAVYAERRFRARRVVEFLDFLKSWLRQVPDWHQR